MLRPSEPADAEFGFWVSRSRCGKGAPEREAQPATEGCALLWPQLPALAPHRALGDLCTWGAAPQSCLRGPAFVGPSALLQLLTTTPAPEPRQL